MRGFYTQNAQKQDLNHTLLQLNQLSCNKSVFIFAQNDIISLYQRVNMKSGLTLMSISMNNPKHWFKQS